MDVKEKLVELLGRIQQMGVIYRENQMDERYPTIEQIRNTEVAARLIANGVTMQEWISVKNRLPEEDGKYLVFEQNNGRTNTSILRFAKDARKVDRYDFKSRWKNAWYEYDSEWGHYTVDSVTHWMPLPEPPKGE